MAKQCSTHSTFKVSERTVDIHNSYLRSVAQRSSSVVALGFGALLTVQGCLMTLLADKNPFYLQILGFVVAGLGVASAIASFILLFWSTYRTKRGVYEYVDLSQQYLCAACCDYYCNNFTTV